MTYLNIIAKGFLLGYIVNVSDNVSKVVQ